MEKIRTILNRLGIRDGAQTVYISLLKEGKASARLLAQRTGITRPSVYDHVKVLLERDLIVELDVEGKAVYALGDRMRLDEVLREEIETLEEGRTYFKEVLPTLLASLDHIEPRVRFFEGKKGVEQLMKDLLWHDHITLEILWPYHELLEVLGEAFLAWFDERRRMRDIQVKALWPHNLRHESKHLFVNDGVDVERRFLAKDQSVSMGYIIYKEKVAFMSSRKEGFGFIVESKECSDLMRMQFKALWDGYHKKK